MKYILFLLITFISYSQEVVVFSGDTHQNQNFSLDYSFGQLFYQSSPDSEYTGVRTTYKEGVHQVYYVDAGIRSLNFDVIAKAYPKLVVPLIKAVQELSAEVDRLKDEIAQLKKEKLK